MYFTVFVVLLSIVAPIYALTCQCGNQNKYLATYDRWYFPYTPLQGKIMGACEDGKCTLENITRDDSGRITYFWLGLCAKRVDSSGTQHACFPIMDYNITFKENDSFKKTRERQEGKEFYCDTDYCNADDPEEYKRMMEASADAKNSDFTILFIILISYWFGVA